MFYESNLIPIKAVMYITGLTLTLEYKLILVQPLLEYLKKSNKL